MKIVHTSHLGIKGVSSAAACALLIVAADCARAAEYKVGDADFFVSPAGNDAWSGKLAEPAAGKTDGPFATLQGAKEAVHAALQNSRQKPAVVFIRGGEYFLERTVVFGPEDSGTEKAPVVYAAYPGEHPVLSAGRKITGWRKARVFPDSLPEAARGNVWVANADLISLHSLYNGTKRLPRAVSGDMATATDGTTDDLNDQPKKFLGQLRNMPEKPLTFSKALYFQGNDLQAWSNLQDVEIVVRPGYRWLMNILPLASVDTRSKTATFAIPPTYHLKSGNKYKIENALTFLDQPGEWVWHGKERQIYYWPETPLAESDIRAPVLQEFIRVEGLENGKKAAFISFIGLEFRHNERDVWRNDDRGLQHDWEKYDKGNAFLRFRHAQDCVVRDCRFRAGSGTGIRLDLYCQRIRIDSNELHDLGGTGILLSGYAPGTVDVSKSNIVTNNWIHRVGRLFTHSAGIFVTQSGHNQITHNTINDLPYNGIVISGCRPLEIEYHKQLANRREWVNSLRMDEILAALGNTPLDDYIDIYTPFLHARDNLIAQNEVYDVMKQLSDGNPIYLSAMGVGNRIEENYLHDSAGGASIRLDDQSTFTYINRNVLVRNSVGLAFKADHVCRNNFIIDPWGRFQGFPVAGVATSRMQGGTTATNNVYYLTQPDSRAYLVADKPFYTLYDKIEGCVYFGPSPTGREQPDEDLLTGKQVTPGKDKIGVLFADPGFDLAAMREKRFVFKADSPALKLGIEPLDLHGVGSSLAPKDREPTGSTVRGRNRNRTSATQL